MTESNIAADPLLAQLNGEDPMPPRVDPAPDAAPSREVELTVAAPAVPSAVEKADKVFSTRAGGKGYAVVVKGEYFADNPSGRGKILKPYELEFYLPHLEAALSVIKNKLLEPKLRKTCSDFVAVRTHKIVGSRPLSPETPETNNIQYMDRAQLEVHIKFIRAPIDPSAYADAADLRETLIDFIQTPDGFEKREAERRATRAGDAELAKLNPGIEIKSQP